MSNIEMKRRLNTISGVDFDKAIQLIREGNGGQTIAIETGLSIKQVNAICQWQRA